MIEKRYQLENKNWDEFEYHNHTSFIYKLFLRLYPMIKSLKNNVSIRIQARHDSFLKLKLTSFRNAFTSPVSQRKLSLI